MLEALLFGHERGAFTGAQAGSKGLMRAAHGGTLLLDEIAELPLGCQAKLLRALQEREVLAIGATTAARIDVRVVATANRDLVAEVGAGRFRADLFYRLAVFPLTTTALAERPADLLPITALLLLRRAGPTLPWPTEAALAKLASHSWPGNVRELGNVLERALVYADGDRIDATHIVFDAAPAAAATPVPLGEQVRAREFEAIRRTLDDCDGRRIDAAQRLGISERTLRYKLAAMAPRALETVQ
jgi:two-component system response regulator FlrC